VEERMMQRAKEKLVLEHLVVRKMGSGGGGGAGGGGGGAEPGKAAVRQEELDDILRYGTQDLFAEESAEAAARRIVYDDKALEELLDREQVWREHEAERAQGAGQGGEGGAGAGADADYLKAFSVAKFEVREEPTAEEAEAAAAALEKERAAAAMTAKESKEVRGTLRQTSRLSSLCSP
jgi:chromodomain-helicase-DNA-binding protein 4